MNSPARIAVMPLTAPVYRNEHVRSLPAWLEDNRRELIRRWWLCDQAVRLEGGPVAAVDDEFEDFCRCQHDRELARVSL